MVVLAVVALSTLLALGRGFVKEVLSVLGWVGAAVATFLIFFYVPQVRDFARKQIAEEVFADIAAAVAIFTVSLLLLGMVNHAISSRVQGSALGPLDRSLGLVFGLLRGIVLVALAHMVMADWLLPNRSTWPDVIAQARSEPYAAMAANYLKGLVPEDLKARAGELIDQGTGAVEQGKQLNDTLQQLNPGTDEQTPPDSGSPDGEKSDLGTQGSNAGNAGGQAEGSGYKDAERKDLERLLQGQSQ